MKRSSLPRALALAAVLATVTSSCSLFTVPDDVSVHRVTVDLAFGGEARDVAIPPPPAPLGNDTDPIDLGPDIPTGPPAPPPPPVCPPTTAIAPRDPAVASMDTRHIPAEGTYLFRFIGNYADQPPFAFVWYKTIENVQPAGDGFTYAVSDPFTGAKWGFEVQPITDTNTTGGLFLTRLELPEEPGGRTLPFEPQPPMKLLDFPIEAGDSFQAQAVDTAPKAETPVEDPITGAPLLTPSGNTMTSDVLIGSFERFEACEELAHALKVNLDLDITGQYNVRLVGQFWLATQYGGWPIRADYIVSGDLMAGNFADSIMKIDPGDYL